MFKLSKQCLNAPSRADNSQTPRKSCLGLSLIFAVGTMCASLHGAAAASGPQVDTKEGPVKEKAREAADALDGEEAEELERARKASAEGRSA